MAKLQPPKRQTLSESIYQQLLAAISDGALIPGEKLVIDELARELNVSNSPVREALKSLQRDGLVTEIPYGGMYVSDLSETELLEFFNVRGVLEGYAIRIAAEQMDETDLDEIQQALEKLEAVSNTDSIKEHFKENADFHNLIYSKANGKLLPELINQLKRNTERYQFLIEFLDEKYFEATGEEHRKLVQLLRDKNGEEAEQLQRQHASTFAQHLVRRMKETRMKASN